MEAHYYRHEIINRKSKSIPEDERKITTDIHDGETLKANNDNELAEAILAMIKAGINDGYYIDHVSFTLEKENKRRTKRQLISIFTWQH